MIRERVAEDVYVFTSQLYAQVNAGAIVGHDWSILIDTLAYPEETVEIRDFIEGRLSKPVRYIINTHYHSDHTLGNCWFPEATIISHKLCRTLLDTEGRETMAAVKRNNRELRNLEIVLPDVVFDTGNLSLQIGKRSIRLIPLPGHSPDGIGVLLEEDRVLFSGDILMPVPYLVNGDFETMIASMKSLPAMKLENIVQGHGETYLRGEVTSKIQDNIAYLNAIRSQVRKASRRKDYMAYLSQVDIESCGKSRILLGGLAEQLHRQNLTALFEQYFPDRVEK
jgi:glyoxylase-like metal-dependent hydrolase (beta-lactamase superfamily II)